MIKKYIITLFSFLLIILFILGFQWLNYQKMLSKQVILQENPLKFSISVEHRTKERLKITQLIEDMEQESFYINVPNTVEDFQCTYSSNEECITEKNKNALKLSVNGKKQIKIAYEVGLDPGKNSYFFDQWFVHFLDYNHVPLPVNMVVTLTEKYDKEAAWAAGAVNKAKIRSDSLTFYAWEKEAALSLPLYMEYGNFSQTNHSEKLIVIGGTNNFEINKELLHQLPEKLGLTLFLSKEKHKNVAPLLAVINAKSQNSEIGNAIVKAVILQETQPKSKDIEWLWDSLTSLVTNRITDEGKGKLISEELNENLTSKMKKDFSSWLLSSKAEPTISAEQLDKQLEKITGFQTSFFTMNKDRKAPFIPLYFSDLRPIYLGDELTRKNFSAILKNKQYYLPLVPVASAFAFSINKVTPNEIYVTKKGQGSLRLLLNESYFIFNEENYGITNDSIQKLGNDVYLSEQFIEEILQIEMIKRKEAILLQPLK